MTKTIATLTAAAALTLSLLAVPASAQNNPPPGNVNPGSLNSGAEESGAEDQPRSNQTYGPGAYYGGYSGAGAYAAPFGSTDSNLPAMGYAPLGQDMPRGAPIQGADR